MSILNHISKRFLLLLSLLKGDRHEPRPDAPNYVLECRGGSFVERPTKHRNFPVIIYSDRIVIDRWENDGKEYKTVGRGKVAGNVYASGFGRWLPKLNQYALYVCTVSPIPEFIVIYADKVTNDVVHFEFPHHTSYDWPMTTKEMNDESNNIHNNECTDSAINL